MISLEVFLPEEMWELALRAMEEVTKNGTAGLVTALESTVIQLKNAILVKAPVNIYTLKNLALHVMGLDFFTLVYVKGAAALEFLSLKKRLTVRNVMVQGSSSQKEPLSVKNAVVQASINQGAKSAMVLDITNLNNAQ